MAGFCELAAGLQAPDLAPSEAKLRTYLGRVIRDISRKIEGNGGLEAAFAELLLLARRVREQQPRQRGPKVYSLHAPEV
jgi:transposase, IS5 family